MDAVLITLVGTVALFVAGLPLARLAYPGDEPAARWMTPTALVVAPVLGYAVITVPLRATAALGLGVGAVAWPLTALLLAILVVSVRRTKWQVLSQLRASWPTWVGFAAIVALLSASHVRIGAQFYRGYGWWDTAYYAAQAEAVRVASPYDIVETFGAQPFTSMVTNFEGGPERFARAMLQAYVASLSGVEGAATVGFVGIVGVGLIFLALAFLVRDLPMSPALRLLACASAALTPGVVLGQLEGFLPLTLLTSASLVVIRLWVDLADEFNAWRLVASAALLSTSLFTLMESLYVLGAVGAAIAGAALVIARKPLRGAVAVVASWPIAVVFCLPLGDRLLSEVVNSREVMTRTSLNTLYPFANTPRNFTWSLWGTQLEGRTDTVAVAAAAVATLLVVLGFHGILSLMLHDLSLLGVALSAYVVLPMYFLFSGEDLRYSLFKMFSLTFPVLWLGAWGAAAQFASTARTVLTTHERRWVAPALGVGAMGVVMAASLLAVGQSARKTWAVAGDGAETSSTRVGYWRTFDTPGFLDSLTEYESWEDEDVVLAHTRGDQQFWMSAYYLRHNRVWSLGATADDLYSPPGVTPRDLGSAPASARLVFAPNYQDWGMGAEQRARFALIVEGSLGGVMTPFEAPGQAQVVDRLIVRVQSRETVELALVVESQAGGPVAAQGPTGPIVLDPGRNVLRFAVQPGGQEFEVVAPPQGTPVTVVEAQLR